MLNFAFSFVFWFCFGFGFGFAFVLWHSMGGEEQWVLREVFVIETRSHYLVQAGLDLGIFLPQPRKCWMEEVF